jgi:5-methylcytosine-specific restriction protein B
MNTADRSIALMDTALRRRFEFVEMMPNPENIKETIEGISLQSLLRTINERITLLLDRDHTIGHSYFMNLNDKNDLAKAFKNKIIPLLQEYFYNDWYKIQLVLGDNDKWGKPKDQRLVLVEKTYSSQEEKDLFGEEMEDYEDVKTYRVNKHLVNSEYENIPLEAFVNIYTKPKQNEQGQ